MIKRTGSSARWLRRHFNDRYVQETYQRYIRSRSWFKLADLDNVDNLFSPGIKVIDLGSSPGGWSQYVVSKIGYTGRVIACDMLYMNPIVGVDFLHGNIGDPSFLQILSNLLDIQKVDVILSDMSPNISGKSTIDIPRCIFLGEIAINICRKFLNRDGSFVVKMFQGRDLQSYINNIYFLFDTVKIRKPNSSRVSSREVYIVAKGYKL